MNEEFWMSLLYLVVIPLVQQGLKLLQDYRGKPLDKLQNQFLSAVLAVIMAFLTGEFGNLSVPEWSGDLVSYVEGLLAVVGTAWAAVMLIYEVLWDRLFVTLKVATRDKLS